jgi:hypothetical protein
LKLVDNVLWFLEDAEEALKNGVNSIGDIIDAIFFGIEQRVKELRGS